MNINNNIKIYYYFIVLLLKIFFKKNKYAKRGIRKIFWKNFWFKSWD